MYFKQAVCDEESQTLYSILRKQALTHAAVTLEASYSTFNGGILYSSRNSIAIVSNASTLLRLINSGICKRTLGRGD